MAKINSSTYSDFTKNALVLFRRGYDRVPQMARQMFEVIMSETETSEHSGLDGFTFAKRKAQGDNYRKETPTQNYSKTLTKYRIGLETEITWEMRQYDKYMEMRKALARLGEAAAQRLELDLTHRFTFATDTSYTDQDGVTVSTTVGDTLALASASHTVPGSSTTYSNIVTGNPALSRTGLEVAEKLYATQMLDASGNKIVVQPDTLVIADNPVLENVALEYLNSTAAVDGGNSGVTNVYKGKYRLLKLPYLATTATGAADSTKENYWMLADLAHTDAICEISEAPHMVAPSPGSNAEDFDNDDWKYKCSAAYAIEIVDPRWIVISTGLGA